jgi:hypothetical protein
MVVRDIVTKEFVVAEATQFALVRRVSEETVNIPKLGYNGEVVDVDVGVRSGQDRMPGDRVAFDGGFGTVVGKGDKGLFVQTDVATRLNRGVSVISGQTRLIRRIELDMKGLHGALAGDVVERDGKLYVVGVADDLILQTVEGNAIGPVDGDTRLVLRHDFPAAGAPVLADGGTEVIVSDCAFRGLRVMPGDVVKVGEKVLTIVGAIAGGDIWCTHGASGHGLPGSVLIDTDGVTIVETVYSRVVSSVT